MKYFLKIDKLKYSWVRHHSCCGGQVGEGRDGAHDQAPLERHRHDAVHDEGDQDEVPGGVEGTDPQGHVEHGLEFHNY